MIYKIDDIVNKGLCVGCGLCTSESTDSKMIWSPEGFLVPQLDNSFDLHAIKLCPFNPTPDNEVKNEDALADLFLTDTTKQDSRIGKFENTYVGYSNEYRETSSSGGIATFIFEKLLLDKIVDHLFIVKEINGNYEYQWFNSTHDIKMISKTRYIPVTMENLFKEIDAKEGKVALSGVACFIKAIRLKQYYNPQYREKIAFLIGIICGGLKSKFFTDYLAQKSGVTSNYSNQEYRIKDATSTASDYSFGAFDDNSNFYQIRMNQVGDMWGTGLFKSLACDFCDDVTTELADISLGDAWLNPYTNDGRGTSVIVTRSKVADELICHGINNNELSVKELTLESFKKSQEGSFKHRQKALRYRLDKFSELGLLKRKRFYQNIPIEFKVVQKLRMALRKKSLDVWSKDPNFERFDNAIEDHKKDLQKFTLYYHIVQKLRGLLGLKKL